MPVCGAGSLKSSDSDSNSGMLEWIKLFIAGVPVVPLGITIIPD